MRLNFIIVFENYTLIGKIIWGDYFIEEDIYNNDHNGL